MSKKLPAKVLFEKENETRMTLQSGTSDYKGEPIKLAVDAGCGITVSYKGENYRLSPEHLMGGLVDAVDGTVMGEKKEIHTLLQ